MILQADPHVDNLVDLFYEPMIKAKNGVHGQGKKMNGRAGADKIVKVPVGTVIYPAKRKHQRQRPKPNVEFEAIGNRQLAIGNSSYRSHA